MFEFLSWLESSALGQLLRSSGIWTYGLLNLGHILGISTLFGSVLVLDLRLLGAWRGIPLALIERPTLPLSVIGFCLAVASGICMISVNATEYDGNPFMFYVKFPALGVALANIVAVQFLPAWRERHRRELSPNERTQLMVVGGISLVSWLLVVGGGRMIGYW